MSKHWIPGLKKAKKVELPKVEPKEPRTMEELNVEYTKLCSQAGQLQYELKAKGQLLDKVNQDISFVISESDARRKLDEAKPKETQNV